MIPIWSKLPFMSQRQRSLRDEWPILALVAAGVVLWAMWHGAHFFDAVNAVILAVFWFGAIMAVLYGVLCLFTRFRQK